MTKDTLTGAAIGIASSLLVWWLRDLKTSAEPWREVVQCGGCKRTVPRYFLADRAWWFRGPTSRYLLSTHCRKCRLGALMFPPREGEREWFYNVRTLGEIRTYKKERAGARALARELFEKDTRPPSPPTT